jgi:hypothetical protein
MMKPDKPTRARATAQYDEYRSFPRKGRGRQPASTTSARLLGTSSARVETAALLARRMDGIYSRI